MTELRIKTRGRGQVSLLLQRPGSAFGCAITVHNAKILQFVRDADGLIVELSYGDNRLSRNIGHTDFCELVDAYVKATGKPIDQPQHTAPTCGTPVLERAPTRERNGINVQASAFGPGVWLFVLGDHPSGGRFLSDEELSELVANYARVTGKQIGASVATDPRTVQLVADNAQLKHELDIANRRFHDFRDGVREARGHQ